MRYLFVMLRIRREYNNNRGLFKKLGRKACVLCTRWLSQPGVEDEKRGL